ncbi:MAG TPA: ABC transporter permease [Terriglobales bacterium]
MGTAIKNPLLAELVVEPQGLGGQYWNDLWSYRELLYFLTWRDLLVRYKQTVLGVFWALIRPLLTMIVFTFLFGRIARLPSEGAVPYAVMVYVAMVPMQFITTAVSDAGNSLVQNPSLVSKIYFPRVIVPASSVITAAADACVSFVALLAMMGWYHVWPDGRIFVAPAFVALAVLISTGLGLWLAALNVAYRDFRHIVPFVVQLAMYISPVGFSSSLVPHAWRFAYSLNPAVGVIDGFRWALLRGAAPLYWPGLAASAAVAIILWLSGIAYFRRMETTFADVI